MAALLIVNVLALTFQSVFCRLYTSSRRGEGAEHYTLLYCLLAGLGSLALNGFSYAPSGLTVLLGLLGALSLYLYNIALVKASSLGSFAFLMVGNLVGGTAMPIAYDVIFLGNHPTPLQWAAIGVILVSFVLMNLEGLKEKKNRRYLLWVLLLFLANGVYMTLMGIQQSSMNYTQRPEMLVTTYLGAALLVGISQWAIHPRSFSEGFRMPRAAWLYLVLAAACCIAGSNLTLALMNPFGITTVNVVDHGGVLVCSALVAWVLFKEKASPAKIAGLVLAGIGLIALVI